MGKFHIELGYNMVFLYNDCILPTLCINRISMNIMDTVITAIGSCNYYVIIYLLLQ